MKLKFTKMHGLGNDFIVLDGIHQAIHLNQQQIRLLADRHFGIGCDQILLVEKASG
ncbi:MAG: diaminopimelate epimerase, partial [Pseudomonadota bacterium]